MTAAPARKQISKMFLSCTDITGIDALTRDDILLVLDLAGYYVAQNRRRSQSALLKGMVMVNMFLENSTRTRLSFEMAAKRLGCEVINVGTEGSSIAKGESFTDTVRTVGAMRPDLFVLRAARDGAAEEAADILDCPVVNGGDGRREHPTQALLDALTLRRRFGRIEGLKVAICGDILHSRVAHSNILLLRKLGAEVSCAGPAALMPGGKAAPLEEALKGADAVMTLRIQKERLEEALNLTDAEYFRDYGLTAQRLALAKPDAAILDPGPVMRGVAIDPALADDPERSLISGQVEAGVAVRMACLDLLTRGAR